MVRHTHQDFLNELDIGDSLMPPMLAAPEAIALETIRDVNEAIDLFDFVGQTSRKIPLSHLDTFIDEEKDWQNLVGSICGVNLLYLIDDRKIINPIMRDYAFVKNAQYLKKLSSQNINGRLIAGTL